MSPLLSLLLGLGNALAHYPHDPATWVAISPVSSAEEEDEGPAWVATSLWRTEAWMVVRSRDREEIEVSHMMPGLDDRLVVAGAFATSDRLLLATTAHGLWLSEDAGRTWTVHADFPEGDVLVDLVASPEVATDGRLVLLGEHAVYTSADAGDTWTSSDPGTASTLVDVDLGHVGGEELELCVLDLDGKVACSADGGGSWGEPLDSEVVDPWQLAVASAEHVYVGGESGVVACVLGTEDDGSCKPTSFPQLGAMLELTADGSLFAASLDEALFRSLDGGETWERLGDELEAAEAGQGGPRAEEHYFELVEAGDGSLWLAAWEGIAWSEDGGDTWTRLPTARQQTVRSVTLSRGEDEALVALLASYGGGALLTPGDLDHTEQIAQASQKRYLRHLLTTSDWARDGYVAIAGAGTADQSRDFGASWADSAAPLVNIQRGAASEDLDADAALLLVGGQGGALKVGRSEDLGETWTVGEVDTPCIATATALASSWQFSSDGTAWAGCQTPGFVYETTDRGESWTALTELGESVLALAGVAGGPLFVGADSGLHRLEAGELTATHFPGEQVQHVTLSTDWEADPTVFAVLSSGSWWRSDDGGESWAELSAPSAAYPLWVTVSPDFTLDDAVAVSGYGGAWLSTDRGETWADLRLLEWHEEDTQWLVYSGDWTTVLMEEASQGAVRQGVAGSTARFRYRGERVQIHASGSGSMQVSDDVSALTIDVDATVPEVVLDHEPATEGWRELLIEVVTGEVALDVVAVERRGSEGGAADGGSGDDGVADDTGGSGGEGGSGADSGGSGHAPAETCGCGGDGGAVASLVLAVVGWRRRRDRAVRAP